MYKIKNQLFSRFSQSLWKSLNKNFGKYKEVSLSIGDGRKVVGFFVLLGIATTTTSSIFISFHQNSTGGLFYTKKISESSSSSSNGKDELGEDSPTATTTNRNPKIAFGRIRRANTRISSVDTVVMRYEESLRDNASLEKLFKYFSSQVVDGRELMTPLDFTRAITPGCPPSPSRKPINIPMFETPNSYLLLSEREVPKFFHFVENDHGLISFGRFLIMKSLIEIPEYELDTAYYMSCGKNFRDETLRSEGMTVRNFDFIMTRNIKVRGLGYDPTVHSPTSILRYLFGPNLDKTLTLEEFKQFVAKLHYEILKLEFLLLSDGGGGIDGTEQPTMSVAAFAKSVASLVPVNYRKEFAQRARELEREIVPCNVLNGLNYRPEDDSEDLRLNARQAEISFEDFVTWKECLKSLDLMEALVFKYSSARFSPSNMIRASVGVTKGSKQLTHAQVWALFRLFDIENKGELKHENFVRLLSHHIASTEPTTDPDGLGLTEFAKCIYDSCSDCFESWFDGTTDTQSKKTANKLSHKINQRSKELEE